MLVLLNDDCEPRCDQHRAEQKMDRCVPLMSVSKQPCRTTHDPPLRSDLPLLGIHRQLTVPVGLSMARLAKPVQR